MIGAFALGCFPPERVGSVDLRPVANELFGPGSPIPNVSALSGSLIYIAKHPTMYPHKIKATVFLLQGTKYVLTEHRFLHRFLLMNSSSSPAIFQKR